MSIIVQYVGFVATARGREYNFLVREAPNEPREFTLTIGKESFETHLVRYQDGADICSRRLRRELDIHANYPPETSYQICDTELEEYRKSHSPKAARGLYPRKDAPEF